MNSPIEQQCVEFVGSVRLIDDSLHPQNAQLMQALLSREPSLAVGECLPLLWHWLYFNDPIKSEDLKSDGHERLGNFLPPVPYPKRMWAGSCIEFSQPLAIGETATKRSEISSVLFKKGSSGKLCFVEVEHQIIQSERTCLTDRQTLVYREPASSDTAAVDNPARSSTQLDRLLYQVSRERTLGSVDLFRYSALTFNSHRIHYDQDYSRQIEGYPNIVVHGPLMATLLVEHAQDLCNNQSIMRFEFRAVSPLFVEEPFCIASREVEEGLELLLIKKDNTIVVKSNVYWG
ncbi:MAG: MaoC family dehydratase N-terminal domain-containing protein [Gammaproteobacteria bacterium]|nr:MaoC family dehydratase N-terminal domain-containing protein [Gammaproteobacteria bacterium]